MFKKTRLFEIPIPFFGSFEEVNLRFYVRRIECKKVKKGVVFINETVPFKIVALLANKLYKEHYISIPTKNTCIINDNKNIVYEWKKNEQWNSLTVKTETTQQKIESNSIEEFIFERYFGFTKLDNDNSQEYRIAHPKWMTNKILNYNIQCDFGAMYGAPFAHLTNKTPDSIIQAEGSAVTINWERDKF
jgi:uncharacterized protein YqjF (DUF2071 family)